MGAVVLVATRGRGRGRHHGGLRLVVEVMLRLVLHVRPVVDVAALEVEDAAAAVEDPFRPAVRAAQLGVAGGGLLAVRLDGGDGVVLLGRRRRRRAPVVR